MFGFNKKKKYFITADKIKRLIDSNEGCIATDRITVDGCNVGFMYREEPDQNGYPDSGWRFMAGDEDDDYMNNSENHAIYQINTTGPVHFNLIYITSDNIYYVNK